MQKRLELSLTGLVTSPGPPQAPSGSMSTCENADVEAPGCIIKRKGFARKANGFGGPSYAMASTKQLGSNLLINFGTNTAATGLRVGDGSVAPTLLSTPDTTNVSNPVTARMKVAVLGQSHYITSTRGTLRYNPDNSLSFAGAPKAIGFDMARLSTNVLTGTAAWLADGYGVAYRVVWGTRLTDSAQTEVVGSPSGRCIIQNVTGTTGYGAGVVRNTSLRILVPKHVQTSASSLTTSWFLRLYRSQQVQMSSGNPSDEMQQCFEYVLTSTDLSNRYVEVTDSCPDAAVGGYLYTNTISGGDVSTGAVAVQGVTSGVLAANDPPPIATDVAEFANCLFYSNLTPPRRTYFSIIAVGTTGNVLTAGDTITVDGQTYTAVAGAPASAVQFTVVTAGTVAANIRQTAINFTEAVNANSSNTTVWAFYVGNDSSPGTIGKILLETRRVDGSDFNTAASAHGSAYLPAIGGSGVTSVSPTTLTNGLACSKPLQGDAVPPANYFQVGRADTAILRIIPLRDALFIFTDDGVFWLRGDAPSNFAIERFSTTFHLLARECVTTCEDAIYAWGYEGIARITASGVEYLDTPIRNYVQNETGLTGSNFGDQAFAVSYRSKRRVVFAYGVTAGQYLCTKALVWNIATSAWSSYSFAASFPSCGAVRYSDDLFFYGDWNSGGTDSYMYQERHAGTKADFADDNSAGSSSSILTTLVFTANSPDPSSLFHWQELQLFWNTGPYRGLSDSAGSATIYLNTEMQTSLTYSVLASVGGALPVLLSRIIIGNEAALGAKQNVVLSHSLINDGFAIAGMSLIYTPLGTETLSS